MTTKAKVPICGERMLQGEAARRKIKFGPLIRCDLVPNHEGNHAARLQSACYEWNNLQHSSEAPAPQQAGRAEKTRLKR